MSELRLSELNNAQLMGIVEKVKGSQRAEVMAEINVRMFGADKYRKALEDIHTEASNGRDGTVSWQIVYGIADEALK